MKRPRILHQGIVKVQIPVDGSIGQALVYFENREPYFLDVTPALRTQMGGEFKRYFEAELHDDGIVLGRHVADQPW